jgi:hypothetical protein
MNVTEPGKPPFNEIFVHGVPGVHAHKPDYIVIGNNRHIYIVYFLYQLIYLYGFAFYIPFIGGGYLPQKGVLVDIPERDGKDKDYNNRENHKKEEEFVIHCLLMDKLPHKNSVQALSKNARKNAVF